MAPVSCAIDRGLAVVIEVVDVGPLVEQYSNRSVMAIVNSEMDWSPAVDSHLVDICPIVQ